MPINTMSNSCGIRMIMTTDEGCCTLLLMIPARRRQIRNLKTCPQGKSEIGFRELVLMRASIQQVEVVGVKGHPKAVALLR